MSVTIFFSLKFYVIFDQFSRVVLNFSEFSVKTLVACHVGMYTGCLVSRSGCFVEAQVRYFLYCFMSHVLFGNLFGILLG